MDHHTSHHRTHGFSSADHPISVPLSPEPFFLSLPAALSLVFALQTASKNLRRPKTMEPSFSSSCYFPSHP